MDRTDFIKFEEISFSSPGKKMSVLGLFALILGVSSSIVTNSGCTCALTAAAANGTGPLGCATRLDWTSQPSKWCLTAGSCGTFYTGFGYTDSCSQAGFPSVNIVPPTYLEWEQVDYTFYTGQTITVNWTAQNINVNEMLKVSYSTRTLTSGSGVNVTAGTYSSRIGETGSWIVSRVPVLVNSISSPSVAVNSSQLITVLQSKISYVNVYDGANLIVSGRSIVADNRNVTIQWRGLGQAGVGTASVTVRNGFGTTVGTAMTGLIAQGNMSVNYIFPRSFTNGFGTFTAQISVQSPGAGVAPYTLSSTSFNVRVASTQTPTPTQTPTSSITPSQTPSTGSSPSTTPSETPTSSVSVSQTPTPSPTQIAAADLFAMAAAASKESANLLFIIVGGSIATFCFVGISVVLIYKSYINRLSYKKRMHRQMHSKASSLYSVTRNGDTVTYLPQMQMQMQMQTKGAYRSSSSKILSG